MSRVRMGGAVAQGACAALRPCCTGLLVRALAGSWPQLPSSLTQASPTGWSHTGGRCVRTCARARPARSVAGWSGKAAGIQFLQCWGAPSNAAVSSGMAGHVWRAVRCAVRARRRGSRGGASCRRALPGGAPLDGVVGRAQVHVQGAVRLVVPAQALAQAPAQETDRVDDGVLGQVRLRPAERLRRVQAGCGEHTAPGRATESTACSASGCMPGSSSSWQAGARTQLAAPAGSTAGGRVPIGQRASKRGPPSAFAAWWCPWCAHYLRRQPASGGKGARAPSVSLSTARCDAASSAEDETLRAAPGAQVVKVRGGGRCHQTRPLAQHQGDVASASGRSICALQRTCSEDDALEPALLVGVLCQGLPPAQLRPVRDLGQPGRQVCGLRGVLQATALRPERPVPAVLRAPGLCPQGCTWASWRAAAQRHKPGTSSARARSRSLISGI